MNYYNYFTEVEEHFVRRRGKHMWISPLDWSLVSTWRATGVPLHVALRGIDIAMDTWESKPRRGSSRLSTLFYCHDAVMREYANYLEAHVGENPADRGTAQTGAAGAKAADDGPGKETILKFLDARIREIEAGRSKHSSWESEGLDRVVSRMQEIIRSIETEERVELEALERDLGILDQLLVSELRRRVSGEQFDAWEQEAKKELKVYRTRLPKETYAKIVDDYMRGKIRRAFNVGELSLFRL